MVKISSTECLYQMVCTFIFFTFCSFNSTITDRYGGMKSGLGKVDADKSRTFFYSANDIDKPSSSPSQPNIDHVVKWYVSSSS